MLSSSTMILSAITAGVLPLFNAVSKTSFAVERNAGENLGHVKLKDMYLINTNSVVLRDNTNDIKALKAVHK